MVQNIFDGDKIVNILIKIDSIGLLHICFVYIIWFISIQSFIIQWEYA